MSNRAVGRRSASQVSVLANKPRCRGELLVSLGGPLRRLAHFVLVTALVNNCVNLLPTRAALVAVYLGGVLGAYVLLCEERKDPFFLLARYMIGVYVRLWGIWKLITKPRWVIYRRAGLVIIARKQLLIAVHAVGGLPYLKRHMSDTSFTSVERLLTLTSVVRRQTRQLRVRSKKSWYPSRVLIAYRVYRLSRQVEPAMAVAEQLMRAAMPRGLSSMLSDLLRPQDHTGEDS